MFIPTHLRNHFTGLHQCVHICDSIERSHPEAFPIKSSLTSFIPFLPLCQVGEPVLVLAGDENGLSRKWRKGYVSYEGSQILTDWVCRNTAG